jgi:hypothetical protein
MDLSAVIRKAIEIGDQHGFVTFDQLNELVPFRRTGLNPRQSKLY